MQLHEIVARTRSRRHSVTTQRQAGAVPAPNRLNRDLLAVWPNRKRVSDITYIDTAEGWLYLATVIDLFSRKVVGWAMGNKIDSQLVEAALHMAWRTRKPLAG